MEPFDLGREAAKAMMDFYSDNPFLRESWQFHAWQDGYLSLDGADLEEVRAKCRERERQFRAAWKEMHRRLGID